MSSIGKPLRPRYQRMLCDIFLARAATPPCGDARRGLSPLRFIMNSTGSRRSAVSGEPRLQAVVEDDGADQPRSGERLLPPLRGSCNFEISNHGLRPWLRYYAAPRLFRDQPDFQHRSSLPVRLSSELAVAPSTASLRLRALLAWRGGRRARRRTHGAAYFALREIPLTLHLDEFVVIFARGAHFGSAGANIPYFDAQCNGRWRRCRFRGR